MAFKKKPLSKKDIEAREQRQLEEVKRIKMPRGELELMGIITQRVGGTQIMVLAEDGKERNCRIPGKMQKKVWMRTDDVVIIKLWDFQPSKADVIWRYTPAQAEHLRKKGFVQKILDKMETE